VAFLLEDSTNAHVAGVHADDESLAEIREAKNWSFDQLFLQ
jgi:hypothetical protein